MKDGEIAATSCFPGAMEKAKCKNSCLHGGRCTAEGKKSWAAASGQKVRPKLKIGHGMVRESCCRKPAGRLGQAQEKNGRAAAYKKKRPRPRKRGSGPKTITTQETKEKSLLLFI